MSTKKITWRINDQIHARELRVIGSDAKQIGVMSRDQALSKAREAGLDLVEIAALANPPVVKIVDFAKFKYQEEKKSKAQGKKVKGGELKELRFSPFIAQNDYNVRLQRIKEFLEERNKVRVVVVFMGRQMGSKPFGYQLLKRVLGDLGDSVIVDAEPKFIGRHLAMTISPINKSKKGDQNNVKNEDTQISS